jgi:branched-chain amino acid transport system substrate-binding protein
MRRRTAPAIVLALLALALTALALGGCGGGRLSPRHLGAAKPLVVYSSLPLQGPLAGAGHELDDGIRLAISQYGSRVGAFAIQYRALDDAGARGSEFSAAQTVANAERASEDSRAIAYIGELTSAASEVSIPILNQAGIPQISPTSSAVELTRLLPGTPAERFAALYPTPARTFLRLVPSDAVEIAADLLAMHESGCTKVATLSDGSPAGEQLVALLDATHDSYALPLTAGADLGRRAGLAPLLVGVRGRGTPCVELVGTDAPELTAAAHQLLGAVPRVRLFAPHGLCTSPLARAGTGLGASAPAVIECTRVIRSISSYPGGAVFAAAFREHFGGASPTGEAILGYEAMSLVLQTIKQLGSSGDSRAAVLGRLHQTRERTSVLGPYAFDRYGDTTQRTVALYRATRGGGLSYRGLLTPPRVP